MKTFKHFMGNNLLGCLVSSVLCLLGLAVGWADTWVGGVITAVASGLIGGAVSQAWNAYCRSFAKRIAAPGPTQWYVCVNDVFVGAITDSQYAQLQLDVVRSPSLYFRQAWTVVLAVLNMGKQTIVATMLWSIIIIVGLILSTPNEAMAELIDSWKAASTEDILSNIRAIIWFAIAVGVMTSVYLLAFGPGLPGYRRVFQEAIQDKARILLNVPATGYVSLAESTGIRTAPNPPALPSKEGTS